MPLDTTLDAGTYQLAMQVLRHSDGELIGVAQPWWIWLQPLWRPQGSTGSTVGISPLSDGALLLGELPVGN
ncbi:MAG: hypothetical protein R2932_48180 [Caldilineaceae bacterium]